MISTFLLLKNDYFVGIFVEHFLVVENGYFVSICSEQWGSPLASLVKYLVTKLAAAVSSIYNTCNSH